MNINRAWCMPNKYTFRMKPVVELIDRHKPNSLATADPFANTSRICFYNNDIDPDCGCEYQLDALEFLRKFDGASLDFILFDPPYSPRQVSESYKKLGRTVNMQTTQASFWSNLKAEIARVTTVGGKVISFGWNSGGIGKTHGFEIVEILLVAHGGWHNDTICTVERKVK